MGTRAAVQCPDCQKSRLVPAETHYKCPAVTAWGHCLFTTTSPTFSEFKKPTDLDEFGCPALADVPCTRLPRLFAIKAAVRPGAAKDRAETAEAAAHTCSRVG